MHQALTQIRENTDSPAETHLRLPLKRYGFPEPIINVPVEATGNAAHGPAISDGLRPTQSASLSLGSCAATAQCAVA